jgi:hypothetical protein
MGTINAPFGMEPIYHPSGFIRPATLPLTKTLAEATPTLYQNMPVSIDATGRLAAAVNGSDFIGVFQGVEFTYLDGRPAVSNQWINGTSVKDLGLQSARFYFTRDPGIIYRIQASAACAIDDIGEQGNFTNISSGNSTTGLSSAVLDQSSLSTAQAMLSVVALDWDINNTGWDVAYPILQVRIARHQDVALKAGY